MTTRMTKKRALQRAGLAHVSGWIDAERAAQMQAEIDASSAAVARALGNAEVQP
jgi:hypothetical protein